MMLKECKKHGIVPHAKETTGYFRCKKCRSEAVTESRRKRKLKLVEEAGGKCERCGYNKSSAALQFHHINQKEKTFGVSEKGLTRSLHTQLNEIKKCILLCANCHAEEHAEI